MGWTQHWFEREDLEGRRGTGDSVEAPASKSHVVEEVVVEVVVAARAVLMQICVYLRDEDGKAKVKKIKDTASDEIPTYNTKKLQGFSRIHKLQWQ